MPIKLTISIILYKIILDRQENFRKEDLFLIRTKTNMDTREILIPNIKEGMVLSKPIHTVEGEVLLESGKELKEHYIPFLTEQNIKTVEVKIELSQEKKDLKNNLVYARKVSDSLTPFGDKEKEYKITDQKSFEIVFQHEVETIVKSSLDNELTIDSLNEEAENIEKKILNLSSKMFSSDKEFMLLKKLHEFDSKTLKHNIRSSVLSIILGNQMGLNTFNLFELGKASLYVDIGKQFIDKKILDKNGNLTVDEYNKVKEHSVLGANHIKRNLTISDNIYKTVMHHHENYNGKGYPDNLIGEEIPLYARILRVSESYIAMTSKRIHRHSLSPSEAFELLEMGKGLAYDKEIVDIFTKTITPYKTGALVLLSNNFKAIVVKNNKNNPLKPIVRTRKGSIINLAEKERLEIKSYT